MIYSPEKAFIHMSMSSWDKFVESQLPPIEAFYNNLNMFSEADYECAQRVWKEFRVRNLGEYHDLDLKTDVILLANMFEAFKDTCLEHYSLNPAHFYTSPGLAWKACLKKTRIRLELLTDPDMLLMFEHGIRRGITQVVHRYATVNNSYMGEKFNPDESTCYLQYLQSWTKLDGTPCHTAKKRLFLPPFPLFNVAVMLSRTLTHMLTYNIDLGDGGRGKVALPKWQSFVS